MTMNIIGNLPVLLLLFCCSLQHGALADDYYYNLKSWIEPAVDAVSKGAENGMDLTKPLHEHLSTHIQPFKQLDVDVRDQISHHLKAQVNGVINEIQKLIDIIKKVAVDSASNLQEAVAELDGGQAPAEAARRYGSAQMGTIQNAITDIRLDLEGVEDDEDKRDGGDNLRSPGSSSAFHSLSKAIAEKVLKGADPAAVEGTLLEQIRSVLNQVFSSEAVENQILNSQMITDLGTLINSHSDHLGGHEGAFEDWITQLTRSAVTGAEPQFVHLQNYARQVLNDVGKLCKALNEKAEAIFEEYDTQLGDAWTIIKNE